MVNSMTTIHNTLNKQHINDLYYLWVPKNTGMGQIEEKYRNGLGNQTEKYITVVNNSTVNTVIWYIEPHFGKYKKVIKM